MGWCNMGMERDQLRLQFCGRYHRDDWDVRAMGMAATYWVFARCLERSANVEVRILDWVL